MRTNFKGIKSEIVIEIKETLEEQFQAFPEIHKRLEYIGIPEREAPLNRGTKICYVSATGNELVITQAVNTLESERIANISNWTITGGIRAKIIHECGHLIDKCIQSSFFNIPTQGTKPYRDGVRKLYRKYVQKKSSVVSRYARENAKEFVAEVYTQMVLFGRDTNEYTQEFAILLDTLNELGVNTCQ